ncbi:restriction endonuclease subunit S [Reichenbachiella agarivorans]|uniref:Restriction endonuclease subunit S n=1 Tax=Reichenbachiella agarivorans TaxID=2979464 RepID=A0ABY6CPS0_9BACT|nr:restriction endonuclease subunit S [Reichenbachiella agarivorans]UXP31363.1 restriction endonuclease subunit S [Reichenbachiella agarivorans]
MSKEKKLIPALRFPEFVKDGEWGENTLEEVATFTKGKGVSKADIVVNGKLPCIRYGELYTHYNETIRDIKSYTNLDAKDLVLSEGNDVIIPASGETQIDIATASCVLEAGIALGGDLNIIRTKINGVFLAYYLSNAKKKDIATMAQGIAVVHLYPNQLKTLLINIPKPQEQQKIASCLSSLDELLAAHNDKLDALKDHKKGLLQNLFPQMSELGFARLKDERIYENEDHTILKSTNPKNHNSDNIPNYRFPEFEKDGDWVETRLDQHIEVVSGYAFKSEFFSEKGRKLVTPKNFTKEGKASFDERNTKYTTEEFDSKYLCVADDLLLLLTDLTPSCELLGKPILLKQEDGEVLLNQRIVKVGIKSNLNKRFLLQFFLTNHFHRRVKSTASGTTVRHSSNKIILETDLLLPDNPAEQQKIASCLSAVDELITAQAEKIAQLQLHKKGLMQGLFPKLNK